MSGQIECHAESLLPGLDVGFVELVAFLDGGESRVLPDGPRPLSVHCRVGTSGVREDAWELLLG